MPFWQLCIDKQKTRSTSIHGAITAFAMRRQGEAASLWWGCMFLELPIHFPYSFPDHLERQWWVTLAHSVLPCAETDCVFQPDFSMVHWISVNIFFFFFYEPDKHWEQFRTMLKEIYSQSANRMPGTPMYFSHSQVPSLHLIPTPWGRVSQKYWSSVVWTILQRKW